MLYKMQCCFYVLTSQLVPSSFKLCKGSINTESALCEELTNSFMFRPILSALQLESSGPALIKSPTSSMNGESTVVGLLEIEVLVFVLP